MPTPDAPPAADAVLPGGRLSRWLGAPGSLRRRLATGSSWNAGGFVVHALVLFALAPFVVGRLGLEAYGTWELVVALTGYLGFADLGVGPAIVHYVARHDARGETDEVNRHVASAFLALTAAGVLILAAGGGIAAFLADVFRLAPGFESEARTALLVTVLSIAVALPLNAFSGILAAKLRYDLLVRSDLACLALRTAAIVAVLSSGLGLVALSLVVAVTRILEMGIKSWAAFRVAPYLRLDLRLASREGVRRLLSYGGLAMAIALALQVVWATDPVVLSAAVGTAAAGVYAVGSKLAFYARDLFRAAGRVFEPATAALDAQGDAEGLSRVLADASRVLLALAGAPVLYLALFGEAFLATWMGDEAFRGDAARVLTILAVGIAPSVATYPYFVSMYGLRMLRALAVLVVLEGGLNLALSVALVGPLGLPGVALGTAIPAVLVHLVLLPTLVCRRLGSSWSRAALRAGLPALAAAAVAAPLLRWAVDPESVAGWPAVLLLAAATLPAFGLPWLVADRLLAAGRARAGLVPEVAP